MVDTDAKNEERRRTSLTAEQAMTKAVREVAGYDNGEVFVDESPNVLRELRALGFVVVESDACLSG